MQLENQKDIGNSQVQAKEKQLEELRADQQVEKASLHTKIDELKQKYDGTMDELTQTKINMEREKALKDQRITFQEQRIKEYHEQMQQSIDRYEDRLKVEKDEA